MRREKQERGSVEKRVEKCVRAKTWKFERKYGRWLEVGRIVEKEMGKVDEDRRREMERLEME